MAWTNLCAADWFNLWWDVMYSCCITVGKLSERTQIPQVRVPAGTRPLEPVTAILRRGLAPISPHATCRISQASQMPRSFSLCRRYQATSSFKEQMESGRKSNREMVSPKIRPLLALDCVSQKEKKKKKIGTTGKKSHNTQPRHDIQGKKTEGQINETGIKLCFQKHCRWGLKPRAEHSCILHAMWQAWCDRETLPAWSCRRSVGQL